MEIKDFIVETITNIDEAFRKIKSDRGVVFSLKNQKSDILQSSSEGGTIEFDLTVTTMETDSSGKGGRIGISVVSLGANKEKTLEYNQLSRIKFTVQCGYHPGHHP